MKIYIASSYRNLHAVQLVRAALTAAGHTVFDWPVSERKAALDDPGRNDVFEFCTEACGRADAVLYIGPAGQDSACEVGIAYAAGVPVFGIAGPLEEPGLILRKCVRFWFQTAGDFLDCLDKHSGPCGYWGGSMNAAIPPFVPRSGVRHVVSVSGGKDSTATYLLALERLGGDFEAVFADTGNEHPYTYEYVARLHERTGGPKVQVVKADFSRELARKRAYLESGRAMKRTVRPWTDERARKVLMAGFEPTGIPFLDLCRTKGMFPSRMRAFCSQFLKRFALLEQAHQPLIDTGRHVVSWQGIRAEESRKRSCYPMWEILPESESVTVYRPLMGWTVEDVAAMHRRHNVPLNPLYGIGFSRVGCMPCIQSSKKDIRLMAQKCPEAIAKIRQWERIVQVNSRLGRATFFHQDTTGSDVPGGIDDVVRWSLTRHGGKQFDMTALAGPPISEVCIYAGGLCE